MKTEGEARKCWCPMYRAIAAGNATDIEIYDNRVPAFSEGAGRCIASECMAWRQYEPATCDVETGKEVHPATGYCGLAGKPEA